jgi:hypothetical protein
MYSIYTHSYTPTNSLSAQKHKHNILEQDSKNVTVRTREKVRTGQPEYDSQNRKGRWGQAE